MSATLVTSNRAASSAQADSSGAELPGGLIGIWMRYSPRGELAWSSIVSGAFHVGMIFLLTLGATTLQSRDTTPPAVDVVAAVGDGSAAAGPIGDGRLPGELSKPIGGSSAAASTASNESAMALPSFVADSLPPEVARSLPKLPDVQLPSSGLVDSVALGRGGLFGTGDGSGGGVSGTGGGGHGLGGPFDGMAGTQFFGGQVWGSKFVYVIDHSGSMSQNDALGTAKRELLASLEKLPPESQFQIIFYNLQAEIMPIVGSAKKLVYATDANKTQAGRLIGTIVAEGGTEHVPALKKALSLNPDVIFFLTDGNDLRPAEVKAVTEVNKGRARIHAVEFGYGPQEDAANSLRDLAEANDGSYRYVNMRKDGGERTP